MRCFYLSECLNIAIRTIIIAVIIFLLTKLLGKKQISQLSFFDYIVGITIGSTVADIALDIENTVHNSNRDNFCV